jgi:hypothetical protein
MRKIGRLRLRNKIIKHLNAWQQLGCLVREHASHSIRRERGGRRYLWRLVSGVAKDGRSILIYPITHHKDRVPFNVCQLMLEFEGRGGIVGCAAHIGDAWDIVSADESRYKRKKRTFYHRHWHEQYLKGKAHERESE